MTSSRAFALQDVKMLTDVLWSRTSVARWPRFCVVPPWKWSLQTKARGLRSNWAALSPAKSEGQTPSGSSFSTCACLPAVGFLVISLTAWLKLPVILNDSLASCFRQSPTPKEQCLSPLKVVETMTSNLFKGGIGQALNIL